MGESNVHAALQGSAARESLRRELLAEMGVLALYPTRGLPGAGPSPVFDLSVEHNNSADSVPQQSGVNAIQQSPARDEPRLVKPPKSNTLGKPRVELEAAKQALQGIARPQKEGRARPDLTEGSAQPAAEPGLPDSRQEIPSADAKPTVTPFAFTWFGVDAQLAVLAVQPSQQQQLSASAREMLQRIVAALSPRYRQLQLTGQAFHWPLPADPGIGTADDEQAAEQAVLGFIARRLRDSAAQNLLVLSDDELFFLKSRSHPADVSGGKSGLRREAQFGLTVLQTHSLQSMQAEPALKRSAWQAMQALVVRLAAEANE